MVKSQFLDDAKPMNLGMRLVHERERMIGMTDAERAWRRQFLIDQKLSPHEPVFVPELWRETHNPIRRFYRKPLDVVFEKLAPVLGEITPYCRYFAGKFVILTLGVYYTHYYFKYHGNDWTKKGGWRILRSKPTVLPGQSTDVLEKREKGSDYATRGFKDAPI